MNSNDIIHMAREAGIDAHIKVGAAELERFAALVVAAAHKQAEAVPPDVVRDAERYRWLRDKGFAYADVDLGTDFDEDTFVSYRIKFNVPEPAHYKFEDDEWTATDIDAAIDAAMAQGEKP